MKHKKLKIRKGNGLLPTKIIPDKKKTQNKKFARKKVDLVQPFCFPIYL